MSLANKNKIDKVFLLYILALLSFGLIILTSASAPLGYDKFNDSYFFIKGQNFKWSFTRAFAFIYF